MTYDTKHYQKLVADLQAENDALKEALAWSDKQLDKALGAVVVRDELIAELRRQIDSLCGQLGEAHAQLIPPPDPPNITP